MLFVCNFYTYYFIIYRDFLFVYCKVDKVNDNILFMFLDFIKKGG